MVKFAAGFECGRIEWQNNLCLLMADQHIHDKRMSRHYTIARQHGIRQARDGLPPWMEPRDRFHIANDMGMDVIWDLNHYWRFDDPIEYADNIVDAWLQVNGAKREARFCFNELSFHPTTCLGQSYEQVVEQSLLVWGIISSWLPYAHLVTAEPAHCVGDIESHAAFRHQASIIGLNIYPQFLQCDPSVILSAARVRYPDKPIMITETGLHIDHPRRWQGINGKVEWLEYLIAETHRACVTLESIVLYPFINGVDWNDPSRRHDSGLIREDLTLDPQLSAFLLKKRVV